MVHFITDKMFSVAFWIWDLPGLADDRWIVIDDDYDDDELIGHYLIADTWIGRIADRFASWLYFTASNMLDRHNWSNGFYYFDEVARHD